MQLHTLEALGQGPWLAAAAVFPERTDKRLSWRPYTGEGERIQFGMDGRHLSYARTQVWSPDERSVACFLGRDDALKVWVNQSVVFDKRSDSHLLRDSEFVTIQLRKGWNPILVKSGNWYGADGFCLRLTDPDGVLKYARQPD
jgi:hypothetical protein